MEQLQSAISKILHHLESEFAKLQMGRATPALVEDIMIEQYGSMQPIKNSASINILDPQTLTIAPWDKALIHTIAKAITDAGVGLNPQTMADSVMIKVPQMTEERRKEMCKIVKKFGEEAKVSTRNARADAIKEVKKQETSKEISEDMAKDIENDIQKEIDATGKTIDEMTKKKETDVMKV